MTQSSKPNTQIVGQPAGPASDRELAYYFDGQTKDRLDRGALSARSDLLLKIRDQILKLPEEQCFVALRAIEQIVSGLTSDAGQAKRTAADRKSAKELYDRAAAQSATAASIDSIGKI